MNYLIVGLGNPGNEYTNTRHNVGFVVVDKLIKKLDAVSIKTPGLSEAWKSRQEKNSVFLMKPLTFMNLSGDAVIPFMSSHRVTRPGLIVVHDELDLPLGEVRISKDSSAAGHNGVKSIIAKLGSQTFTRIRIGVGPRPEEIPVDNFVLGKFNAEETNKLAAIIAEAVSKTTACLQSSAS